MNIIENLIDFGKLESYRGLKWEECENQYSKQYPNFKGTFDEYKSYKTKLNDDGFILQISYDVIDHDFMVIFSDPKANNSISIYQSGLIYNYDIMNLIDELFESGLVELKIERLKRAR